MPEPQRLSLTPGSDAEIRIKKFMTDRIRSIRSGLQELHETKVPKWRKAYEARPAEDRRSFPWDGASNLIVPIIAIHSDTLLARVMSAVIKTRPPWVSRLLGIHGAETDGWRDAVEEFMQYVGLEPDELDLYRVYHEWFGETIRLGTSVLKSPWVKQVEDIMAPAGDMSGKYEYIKKTMYEGPRPEKLAFEDYGQPPSANTVEAADFKYHRIRLERFDLEERAFRKIYDYKAVQEIIKNPDRSSPSTIQQGKEEGTGAQTLAGYGFAEWDIYECHFRYRIDKAHFCRVICWFHEKTGNILRAFYFYYPDEIFIASRLFYRDDMFHGIGFCEMLWPFQEEISEIHNQRRDNMTISNMKAFRADPESKIYKGMKVFPSAVLPGTKDEIEALDCGTPVQGEIDSERLSLELSEKRSGVSPPMQGQGAGTNSKRGVYTAMGTLSLLQEGNTRTDLNITDIRYAHTRLGRLLAKEYSEFGADSEFHKQRIEMFGKMGDKIKAALDALRNGKMALPVYGSSASVNLEVEKQNDLMMANTMRGHYQVVTQMLQSATNPMLPPAVQKYLGDAIKAGNILMKSVLRHFGHDEVDRLVPEAEVEVPKGQNQVGGPPQGPQGQQPQPQAQAQPQLPQGVIQ